VDRPDWPNLTSTFALLLQFAGASLKDVMEARTALEPSMAALAAERADPSTIAQLAAILQEARDGLPDQGRFLHAYRTFWMLTAKATGNAVTALLWPALRALVDSGGFVPNEIYREVLVKRMSSLLDALTAADSDAARRIVAEMDVESTKRLVDLYPKRVSRRVGWADVPID
jgi:DNA-binding FadR family transcriptional regulator